MSPEYRSESPMDSRHTRQTRVGPLWIQLPVASTDEVASVVLFDELLVLRAGSFPVCLTAPIRTRPSGSQMQRSRTGYQRPRTVSGDGPTSAYSWLNCFRSTTTSGSPSSTWALGPVLPLGWFSTTSPAHGPSWPTTPCR